MSLLLHLSDTHFGTERPQVVAAVLDLVALQAPDLVVLSGDITQRARPDQFRAARAFADQLGAPVLAIPGNHDIPLLDLRERLTRPYARYAAAFGPELEPVHASPDWLVIGVNTTRAWRHRHGEVSTEQIQHVARLLRQAGPRQLRVVVVHQPMAVQEARERPHLLRGHRDALRAWAAAGADLLLGGHIHLPYTLALHGLERRLWVVQAGTAVSSRVRPGVPNSLNIVRWEPAQGRCSVERWDYLAREQAFVCVLATTLQGCRDGLRPSGQNPALPRSRTPP
ncbi:metallophosphoesterase family protein [Hydrogenophaga pseudoflava]|uniref:metallophosphoesterase family protein n=1 Tax=Hydrogenophaga pseudoflava TaxID=47421 RepID=UPI0027E5966A|nr:metallophosphoesterase [Hydrogenophaga pseudoflava]MDQ7746786.1 metallophosphoesterase [Hydrogenophaga pseudoflava]